jgi:hypothetical protein
MLMVTLTSINEHGWIGEAQVLVLPARGKRGSLAELSFGRRGATHRLPLFLAKRS